MQPHARASLSGVSIATTRAQIAYSILEGIAHSVTACMRANLAATDIELKELVVGGGMSNSDTLLQIQADLSGIPVRRMEETARATLRGAAFLAGSNGLLWSSLEDACSRLRTAKIFYPSLSSSQREMHIEQWEARIRQELDNAARTTAADREPCHL